MTDASKPELGAGAAAPLLQMSRWRCDVCCVEWDRPAMFDDNPMGGEPSCPGCGAHQIRRVNAPSVVLPGIADAIMRDVTEALDRYTVDIEAMFNAALERGLRDRLAGAALQGLIVRGPSSWGGLPAQAYEMADAMLLARKPKPEPHDTERPPEIVELEVRHSLATIGQACIDWTTSTGECHLCGKQEEGAHDDDCPVGEYLTVRTDHGRDASEKEPAFTPQEVGTFDPVVVPIGPMVGPSRAEPNGAKVKA